VPPVRTVVVRTSSVAVRCEEMSLRQVTLTAV